MGHKGSLGFFSSDPLKKGLMPRKMAWDVLMSVSAGAYADIALERVLRLNDLSESDRSLVKELSYGAIRQRGSLDCWIDYLGKIPSKKQPPPLRWLLHLGLYQLIYMNKIPSSAAVNTSVELVKHTKFSRLAPVVNGLLRTAERKFSKGEKLPQPDSLIERLSQEQSLPGWLSGKLLDWFGWTQAERIARAFNRVPTVDLRANRLKTSPESLIEIFKQEGFDVFFVNGYPDAIQVANSSGDVRTWPGYSDGKWTVQDRVAQWVAPLLLPNPGERILDACAAPGGKATHLAELIGDKGEIWAIDRLSERLKRVIENNDRLGITCMKFFMADVTEICNVKPSWKKSFNKILLDAPCSGLGTLSRNPDARWRMSPSKIDELICLQRNLLEGLLPLLMKGGRIVYATCTINPEENELQIKRFLDFHEEINLISERQIYPDPDIKGDGFYAAVMELS